MICFKFVLSVLFFGSVINYGDSRHLPTKDTLVSLVTFTRHGERTPIEKYPKDPLNIKWPVGPGQLLKNGKVHLFKFGQLLRERYSNFLSHRYDETDIHIRATDVDRVIMSAMSCLAGLYPPEGDQIWYELIKWQPIPVHIVEPYLVVNYNRDYCQNYTNLWRDYAKTSKQFDDDRHKELYKYLEENSGLNMTDLWHSVDVRDILNVQNENGYKIPEWAESVFPLRLYNNTAEIFASLTATEDMKRMCSGPFLYNVVNHFKNVSNEQNNTQKMQMFFAHDTNVICLLGGLGVLKPHIPNYGATILFELHNIDGAFIVRVYYMTALNNIEQLDVPNCGKECKLDDFEEALKHVLMTRKEIEAIC